MKPFKKIILFVLGILFGSTGTAMGSLDLDVIPYEDFVQRNSEALSALKKALHEKGIVGIRAIPGYKEKVLQFIASAREFSALPEEIKESYAPNHGLGEMFLGYEQGKEKFKRPNGEWMIDDLKTSYYAYVPDNAMNKWPREVNLRTPFEELGLLMSEMGVRVMEEIGLIGAETTIPSLDGLPRVGRMLYYQKNKASGSNNLLWCGAHFDHGLFTVLLPAFYFAEGEAIPEPIEAGLFVKPTLDSEFKKVIADDPDVMMFQVGEFGQIVSNDEIRATEHRVHKANGLIERYTMALFYEAPMDTEIRSTSELTKDARYGECAEAPCTFRRWHEESFKRYLVRDSLNKVD